MSKTIFLGEYGYAKDDDCLNGRNSNCSSGYTIYGIPVETTQDDVDAAIEATKNIPNATRDSAIIALLTEKRALMK